MCNVVAEAGLLAQTALFTSHRLLGPNVAIGAIDLPADDIFFSVLNDGKQPQYNELIISFRCSPRILKIGLIIRIMYISESCLSSRE